MEKAWEGAGGRVSHRSLPSGRVPQTAPHNRAGTSLDKGRQDTLVLTGRALLGHRGARRDDGHVGRKSMGPRTPKCLELLS